ncbi:MAG: bifunctional phosphoribosylaminoimidazolecarboxamide formyltransferase/IMP cyclohydrolase [Chloroflexi bacterium]|nr:bifunctional phosphoribosylaminoimidazolecarboxamide formyltransferase/IMP cyclohydrolase [Chloroflexota bacterium]
MKALLSVYDKTGITDFARDLVALGYHLVSTGGTHRELRDTGLAVQQVADLTGSPEMLGGRVKTLHPRVHGGILARRNLPDDMAELASHGIDTIDLVAVNLYPFRQTISKSGVTLEDALENIDIGGPTMVRAAAKNFPHVIVVVNPGDYPWVIERLRDTEGLSAEERQGLATKAFQHVALYDTAVSAYLGRAAESPFTQELTIGLEKLLDLRYGENPHQQAALYALGAASGGLAGARQLHGKELSYNNLLDADGAWTTVADFAEPAVAVIKHTNPCGLAIHEDMAEAYRRAYSGDPVSAYGGIVAFNRPVTAAAAEAMSSIFYEMVIAPDYQPDALKALQKKKNLRLLVVTNEDQARNDGLEVRQISGGLLVQTQDNPREDPATWRTVTQRKPTVHELQDMAFAWKAVKHIKSNAIVLARGQTLLGMGAGQPNRITSVQLAVQAAGEGAQGSILASDAFFPFADGIEAAANAGVTAIVQPGGSIRDQEVIEAADRLGLAMLFTGLRHFRH